MRRLYLIILMLMASATMALADTDVRYVYWMDRESVQHELTGNTIDCSNMMAGLHHIHFQAYNIDGVPTPPKTKRFVILKEDVSGADCKVKYWIDNDVNQYELEGNAIDCSELQTGIHNVHFQPYDVNGVPVPSQSKSFLVLLFEESAAYSKTLYWFDNATERLELSGGTIDCSTLTTGLHTVHFQAYDADNAASPAMSQSFIVLIDNLTPTTAYSKIEYWYDDQSIRYKAEGNTFDCSNLMMGLHTIHFQIVDADGKVVPTMSQTFLRTDDIFCGQKLIYWFDQDKERSLMDTTDNEIDVSSLDDGNHFVHFLIANYRGGIVGSEVKSAEFFIAPLRGDANSDKLIDVADITTVASYILDPEHPVEGFNPINADANADGLIDVADITTIASIILHNAKKELEE